MDLSDLQTVIANLQIPPALDVDSATTASPNMRLAPAPGPTTTAAPTNAVWKPSFKEFLYAHRLAPKITSQR